MNFGSFAGGMAQGIGQANTLKQLMTGRQQQGAPQMTPGFEDPNAMMSQAPMSMSMPGQMDQFQQGGGTFGSLQDLMRRLFSQGG